MDILVVGDVHGCYHTLKKLVSKHWNPETTFLIQAGDLVNKGPHSVECLQYWMELESLNPDSTFIIRGNHEQMLLDALKKPFIFNACSSVAAAVKKSDVSVKKLMKWLKALPLKWDNDHILITHAGIAKKVGDPFDLLAPNGVIYNKGPLKRLDKVQVKGHSIVNGNKPVFSPSENAWYIDTGAWTKKYLSAIRFDQNGTKKEIIRVKTVKDDRVVQYSAV